MSSAALPSWLDPELMRWIIVAALALLALLLLMVLRFVQRFVTRFLLLAILVGLGVSLWFQREDLRDCALRCECTLYGQEIVIPVDQLPAELRELDSNGLARCLSDVSTQA